MLGAAILLAASLASVDLQPDEIRALRELAWTSSLVTTADDPVAAILSEAARQGTLPAAALERATAAFTESPALRAALTAIRDARLILRRREGRHAVVWWDARRRAADGAPASEPVAADVEAFDTALEEAAAAFVLPVPEHVPVLLQPDSPRARVVPPGDLRWGAETPSLRDPLVPARLVLLQAGEASFLVEALARAWACGDSRACRLQLLDAARLTCVRAGYVPLREAAAARVLPSPEDPAVASGLMVAEHLQRLGPPRSAVALLQALGRPDEAQASVAAIEAAIGEPPARLDRHVLRDLREWAERTRP